LATTKRLAIDVASWNRYCWRLQAARLANVCCCCCFFFLCCCGCGVSIRCFVKVWATGVATGYTYYRLSPRSGTFYVRSLLMARVPSSSGTQLATSKTTSASSINVGTTSTMSVVDMEGELTIDNCAYCYATLTRIIKRHT
jgi:hypothetical protein